MAPHRDCAWPVRTLLILLRFIGRFNTMIVFLFRPSPQVPNPSLMAALKCFEASRYNIYMQREQIAKRNVDLTWIFTQSIFMAINTLLWSLSFSEVRRQNPRVEVENHLHVGMEAIDLAAQRWPGVASAHELYTHIISAILRIYDKDGDVAISENTPSDTTSPAATSLADNMIRSRTTSPGTFSSSSLVTPPDNGIAPFGYFHHAASRRSVEQPPPLPYVAGRTSPPAGSSPASTMHTAPLPYPLQSATSDSSIPLYQPSAKPPLHTTHSHDSQFQALPTDFSSMNWNSQFANNGSSSPFSAYSATPLVTQMQPFAMYSTAPGGSYGNYGHQTGNDVNLQQEAVEFLNPNMWTPETQIGSGLSYEQQVELMQTLENNGVNDLEMMIRGANAFFNPRNRTG